MKAKYRQLRPCGAFNYLNQPLHGKKADFNITETGLLAGAHREGSGRVCNYLKALDKRPDGQYYMNYSKIPNAELRDKYEHVETRMRKFEK